LFAVVVVDLLLAIDSEVAPTGATSTVFLKRHWIRHDEHLLISLFQKCEQSRRLTHETMPEKGTFTGFYMQNPEKGGFFYCTKNPAGFFVGNSL
jgi:hypothetical protein